MTDAEVTVPQETFDALFSSLSKQHAVAKELRSAIWGQVERLSGVAQKLSEGAVAVDDPEGDCWVVRLRREIEGIAEEHAQIDGAIKELQSVIGA